jgi:hypothetical protein
MEILVIPFFLVLSLTGIARTSPAVPAFIGPAPQIGQVLVIGTIDRAFSARLETALDSSESLRTVQIESGGGLESQAYQATRLLNSRGITVSVIGRCASACALLWAGAEKRELRRGGLIGLHASRPAHQLPGVLQAYARERRVQLATGALRHAGFPEQLITRGLSVPHESVLWLGVDELRAAGVQFVPTERKSPVNSSKPKSPRRSTQS